MKIESPVYGPLRMTIPVREALLAAGHELAPADTWCPVYSASGMMAHCSDVRLAGRTMPSGIVLVLIGHGAHQHRGLRLTSEPEYPQEWTDGAGIAWHERGDWVPCPTRGCGAPLVWFEAGYVPGYRICTRGHHAQLAPDGRSAKSMGRRS